MVDKRNMLFRKNQINYKTTKGINKQAFEALNKCKIKKKNRKRGNITTNNSKLAMQREGVFHGYRVLSEKHKTVGMPTCNILRTLGQRSRIYSFTKNKKGKVSAYFSMYIETE